MAELSESGTLDFSVAICTYNGEQRLPEVLDRLSSQLVEGIRWEVIVVDNNSRDNTRSVVMDYAHLWRSDCELRYVFEEIQGLAFARARAIQSARSRELVGFLDDDNLPEENWVTAAYQFGQEHPNAGAYGGITHPFLDQPPPDYFDQVKLLLAVINRGDQPFQYLRSAKPRRVPIGAGCVVRKQAWQDCVPDNLLLSGRDEAGRSMLGTCEDLETMYYIQNSDWEVWYNPRMEIWHHLPSHRLEPGYLLKIARTSGLSNYALRTARLQAHQRKWMVFLTPLYLLSDGQKVLSYYLKHRQQLSTNLGKACELQARIGRFLSPFVRFL
jgi:GT2 family glycosyltransferase